MDKNIKEEAFSNISKELNFFNETTSNKTKKIYESNQGETTLQSEGEKNNKHDQQLFSNNSLEDQINLLYVKHLNENGVSKWEVSSFRYLSDALSFFHSSSVKKELQNSQNILFLKIQIHENFGELTASNFDNILECCGNKSIVIFFVSKNSQKYLIYWKSKELDYFLKMKPFTETPSSNDEECYDFIADFLANSLINGYLGLDKNYQLSDENNKVEIYQMLDSRGYNLLLLASEKGNAGIAVNFLKLGLDLTDQDQTINTQELALQNGFYEVIFALYKEDIPFPVLDIHSIPEEFQQIAIVIEEFNRMIIDDNLEKIKELFQQLPKTSYCYNFSNESALKVATINAAFKCYEFFVSEKLIFAPHENPEEYFDDLTYEDQRIVREIHYNYTQDLPEKHLSVLMSKSFLAHDVPDKNEKFKFIQKAYRILNADALIKIILMIVAASKNTKIIFDFNRDSVNVVDPTATSDTQGLFYLTGRIYIGAKQLLNEATAHATRATIAHELCHFAMNLVYGNNANPYKRNDNKTIQEFEDISKECKADQEKEEIVRMVYNYYPPDMYHAELIVRVVHLIALYCNQPEKLAEVRQIFGSLFYFYEKKVVSELKEALPEIEKIAENEGRKKDKKITKLKKISIILGIFSVIGITVGICLFVFLYKPYYKFNELPESDQIKVKEAIIVYKGVPIQFQQLFYQDSEAYEILSSDHIMQMFNGKYLNFSDPLIHYLDVLIQHNWQNLTFKLKEKFLSLNFTFQNESLKFKELYEESPKAFEYLNSGEIYEVLNGTEVILDTLISNRSIFYVERYLRDEDIHEIYYNFVQKVDKFKNKSEEEFNDFYSDFVNQNVTFYEKHISDIRANNDYKWNFKNYFDISFIKLLTFKLYRQSFKDILKETKNSRMFILSSEAGTGKTTVFEQFTIRIKKMYPTRWVSYIDLKEYKKFYNNEKLSGDPISLLNLIFNLNNKSKFQNQIFHELYESGQVILLWNGFDEISPDYSDFILNILNSIYRNSSNIQFVCTRPLYGSKLRRELGVNTHILVPYNFEEQEEFLNKFFISKNIHKDKVPDYIEKVSKIVDSLTETTNLEEDREGFNTPQMLEMIADLISSETEIKALNLYEIYKKFIERKIEIWQEKSEYGKQLLRKSFTDYGSKFDMNRIYQMYALKSEYFIDSFKFNIMRQWIPKELTGDEISRMGILYINGKNEFKFAHKTFAEFFIAQFLIQNIFYSNIDPKDGELVFDFFIKVYESYGADQVIITNFINSFLLTEEAKEFKNFDTTVYELLSNKFNRIFFKFLINRDLEIFDFLLKFFKNLFKDNHELFVKLLQINENETFYTASFNYAYFAHNYYYEIYFNRTYFKETLKNHLSVEEFDKLIHGKNQRGIILVSLYIHYRQCLEDEKLRSVFHDEYDLDQQILESNNSFYVFESIAKKLTNDELKELFLSRYSPISRLELNIFEHAEFWNFIKKFLNHQELKNYISNLMFLFWKTDYFFDEYLNFLPNIFNNIEKVLSDLDIFEIFMNNNVLLLFSENIDKFITLWEFLKNHTNINQQRMLLTIESSYECTVSLITHNQKCYDLPSFNVFQKLLMYTRYQDFSKATDFYSKSFNKTEIQNKILKSNDFIPYFIDFKTNGYYKVITNYLKDLFIGNENLLKDYLLRKIKPSNLNILEFIESTGNDANEKFKFFSDLFESLNS